jgi:rhomboid protease GluP
VFLPVAEKLFGKRLLALYLVSGVGGQAVNYLWRPDGGGSSTGIFGVMGALLMYVCRHRNEIPRQYFIFALLGLCGAVALSFVRDGHGPSLLVGALLAAAFHTPPLQISSDRA